MQATDQSSRNPAKRCKKPETEEAVGCGMGLKWKAGKDRMFRQGSPRFDLADFTDDLATLLWQVKSITQFYAGCSDGFVEYCKRGKRGKTR